MTEPLSVKPYVQANAGYLRNPDEGFANYGITAGTNLSRKGNYLNTQVGIGTSFTAKVEAGHEFDIGKNMGLSIGAKGQYAQSFVGKGSLNVKDDINVNNMNTAEYTSLNVNHENETTWKLADTKFGANLGLTKHAKWGNIGIGIEGGVAKSNHPNMSDVMQVSLDSFDNTTQESERKVAIGGSKFRPYVTPTLNADIKLGKNSNFSAIANASIYDGQVGLRYNF